MTTGKRLGWDEEDSVTDIDILDPYDYDSDDLEGDLNIIQAKGPILAEHTIYLIDGEVADPKTIDPEELIRALKAKVEHRTLPFSKVTRSVQRDPNPCKLCLANNDPDKVPVHPKCQCSIKTDEITRAEPDEQDLHELLSNIADADILVASLIRADAQIPANLDINIDTIMAFTDFRYSDLIKYVEDNEAALEIESSLALVIDNDSTLIWVNDFVEGDTALSQPSNGPQFSMDGIG